MSDFGWPRRGFLSLVGLDHPASDDGKERSVELAEGGVDARSCGAIAVTTKATLDGHNGVKRIKTYYWRMLPNGQQLSQKLFDIEFEDGEATSHTADGRAVRIPTLIPHAVWVLGRKVYDAADEGDLEHGDPGLMRNLSRIMGATGEINRQMRKGKLPDVAKIFEQYAVHDAVGEKLVLVGQSGKGGFDFDTATDRSAIPTQLNVPDAVARALTGLDVNDLDLHQKLYPKPKQANDPSKGTIFTTEVAATHGENPAVSTSISPTSNFGMDTSHAIPCLTNIAWKNLGDGRSQLDELNLLSERVTDESHLLRMQVLGATNRILHDLRNDEYPATMDHLVEYGLQDLVYQFEPPPPLAQGGRLTMLSVGGNNMDEIADGFGQAIGGNSKVICHEGLTASGKTDRVGVIVDLGLHLSPKDETDVSAAPDVVEHLKYCNDILITHRHLDHTDGLFVYIQYGYLKGKTVHATPEVIRAIRDKLATYPSIHRDDWPTFAPLHGQGWIHIKDKEGNVRLSVDYARNATPHSARTTPFCVHGHYQGKWIGSYLDHGDARFGRHNAEGYEGPPVDADHLNKQWFSEPNQRFLEMAQANHFVNEQSAGEFAEKFLHRGPTYFDMDITSILKKGWAPTEAEFEEHFVEVADWFSDKGKLVSMISTSDNKYESVLRAATRLHCDVTEFGANLIKTATTMNVLGVNDLRHEPGPRNNIQPYMDQCFEQRLTEKIARHTASLASANDAEKEVIEKKIERNEARLTAFQTLKVMPNQFQRYKQRNKLEAELEERFGRSATLGSLAAAGETDEMGLGAVRVGRATKTSRAIMGMDQSDLPAGANGRRLVLLTGTQGTNVEVDAALVGLAEGRNPTLDGNPKNNHLARPVVPENNVVIIAQTAIPGNDGKQNELVRKLVARGFTVVQAVHDGFKIHHLEPARRDRITARLEQLGKSFEIEPDGTLNVTGMALHAGGHGQEEDCKAWMQLVKADVVAAQHTSDPQGAKRVTELGDELGLAPYPTAAKSLPHRIMPDSNTRYYMPEVVPNFAGESIRAGDDSAATEIHPIGRTLASLIRIRTVRQQRKYHSGHLEAQRIVNMDSEGEFRSDGLRASVREGGTYASRFATLDAERAARASAAPGRGRPEPVPENRMAPPDERPDRGAIMPGHEHRHRYFRQTKRQSAAFVGGT